jgi:hypothetical protein
MPTVRQPRSRARDVSWTSRGVCLDRGDLPWIADPDNTTVWDRLAMAALCQTCPVLSDCGAFASREKVTAGFWAARPRDPEACREMVGPGWAIDPLPGLDRLGGAA